MILVLRIHPKLTHLRFGSLEGWETVILDVDVLSGETSRDTDTFFVL